VQEAKLSKTGRTFDAANSVENSGFSTAIFVLLLLIPIASTVVYGAVDTSALGILAILAALVALLWLAHGWRTGGLPLAANRLQIPLAGLIAIGIIQLVPLGGDASALSIDPYSTRFFVVRLVVYAIFFAAVLTFIRSEGRVKKTAVILIVFGGVMAFFGILQRLAEPDAIYGLRPTPQAIPFGSFVNQHHFAAFMEMTSGLVLGLIFGSGVARDRRILLVIAAVIMGLAVVFTGSRGGMLSYAGVILFAAVAGRIYAGADRKRAVQDVTAADNRQRKLSAIAGAAAVVFIALGLVVFLGAESNLLRGLGFQGSAGDPTSGRSHFWLIGLKIFFANPIIGTGLDTFAFAFPQLDTRSGLYRVENAHNDYLQTLSDSGILGFLCVAAFIWMLFRRGLANIAALHDRFAKGVAVGALAGCFGILIHSFFDFPLRTTSNGFIFLMLAALATNLPIKWQPDRKRNAGE
jgi:O-antigen ligase